MEFGVQPFGVGCWMQVDDCPPQGCPARNQQTIFGVDGIEQASHNYLILCRRARLVTSTRNRVPEETVSCFTPFRRAETEFGKEQRKQEEYLGGSAHTRYIPRWISMMRGI